MRTLNRITIAAPLERVFRVAADVERWPQFLEHYRWVRVLERRATGGLVEMAAWRPFGPFRYPTWWVSEMEVEPAGAVVRYRHVRGITRGMDVEWRLTPTGGGAGGGGGGGGVEVTIVHAWRGPRWPLIGAVAADRVIGPVFIHHIAGRTLAGIKRKAEAL